MCFTWCPKMTPELRQEILKSALSQPRVHETASINEGQVHFRPASPIPLLAVSQESRNLALQSSTIIQFPYQQFYFCPETDILLIDELDTLYEWDGVFAHYIPSTGWKNFCDLLTVMAVDPFYAPFAHFQPPQQPKSETDPWLEFTDDFVALLFDALKKLPKLEEVILLSPDEDSTDLMAHVEKYMKRFAFRTWVKNTGKGKAKEEKADDEEEDEEVEMEKASLNGWEYRVPKITLLAYEYNEGQVPMSAMKRALLAYKA